MASGFLRGRSPAPTELGRSGGAGAESGEARRGLRPRPGQAEALVKIRSTALTDS